MNSKKIKSSLLKLSLLTTVLILLSLSGCASNIPLDDLPAVDAAKNGLPFANTNTNTNNSSSTRSNAANTVDKTGVAQSNRVNGVNDINDINDINNNANINNRSEAIATVQAPFDDATGQPTTGLLSERSIYFDYDSFVIQNELKPVIEAHAKYLNSHRTRTVALEGHTDERGGREYNLALGQKRALAVQQALQLLGVPATQLEAVSFGKEKPKALGQTEADYALNRRVDIQYQ